MNKRDHHVVLVKVMVKAGAAAYQFVDFSGDFHAAETRSNDNEAEVPAPALGIARGLGPFHLIDDVLPQVYGVSHYLEWEGMLGHSRDDAQVTFGAAGDYHVIVVQAIEHAAVVVESYLRERKIDSLDALGAAINFGKHLAERSSRRVDIDGRPGHVRQERVEDHVILRVEKENFTIGRGKFAPQGLGKLHGGKSAADDNDSCSAHGWYSRLKIFGVTLFLMRMRMLRMKVKHRISSKARDCASVSRGPGEPDKTTFRINQEEIESCSRMCPIRAYASRLIALEVRANPPKSVA
jgi:hypothetical protein